MRGREGQSRLAIVKTEQTGQGSERVAFALEPPILSITQTYTHLFLEGPELLPDLEIVADDAEPTELRDEELLVNVSPHPNGGSNLWVALLQTLVHQQLKLLQSCIEQLQVRVDNLDGGKEVAGLEKLGCSLCIVRGGLLQVSTFGVMSDRQINYV